MKPIIVPPNTIIKFPDKLPDTSFLDSEQFLICPDPLSTDLEGKEFLNELLNQKEE